MAENLIGPLRHVYGVSDKLLTMTLSSLLLASNKPTWFEAGASMIAIDTLVHNFLHRTGILHLPYLWRCLLPAQRLRRHYPQRVGSDRRPAI